MTYCLTCDYDACEKIKVKDLFKGLNISDSTCSTAISRINRILRLFYLDTIEFDQNRVSETIVCSWDTKHETKFPIYKLRWFYAQLDPQNAECVDRYCLTSSQEDNICISCGTDPQTTYALKTFPTKWNRAQWQYTIACENTIFFHAYSCFENVTLEYSRWPLKITSLENEIQIDSKMLVALEYYIEWHYALRNRELNMSNKFAELYTQVLQKLADSESFIPYSIGSSNWNVTAL